jgi:hypothetical protein
MHEVATASSEEIVGGKNLLPYDYGRDDDNHYS